MADIAIDKEAFTRRLKALYESWRVRNMCIMYQCMWLSCVWGSQADAEEVNHALLARTSQKF
jgi:hypothetical protein